MAMALMGMGCGTIFGGHITDSQKTKPSDGTHRQVRTGALIGDILTGAVWIVVDHCTGGLYKPTKK